MFTIIKGNEKQTISSRSGLSVYLANGWSLVGEETVVAVVDVLEPTKKELQERLDAKSIAYSPRDSKATLQAKLDGLPPTDNFDDGLLKG
jgi:hypothetical protein